MNKTSKTKQSAKENLWQKTRSLQVGILVIFMAVGSVMLFNNCNGSSGTSDVSTTKAETMDFEPGKVLDVTDANFNEIINDGVVLVDFWAVWCPPCRIQNPIVEQVAESIGDRAKITKLDVDHNPNSASAHGVRNIPTLIIFKDGEVVQRFVGVQQKNVLMAALESHF